MSDLVLATASVELELQVTAAASGDVRVLPPGPLPSDVAQLLTQAGRTTPPAVVVLDCALGQQEALALAGRLSATAGAPRVVLVSEAGPDLALEALRAGVFDLVHPGIGAAELGVVLFRAAAAQPAVPHLVGPGDVPAPRGRVISVVSSKGGVGKTTLSTNIAVGLALHAPQSVVLVDLDVQFGDVASALNLSPEYSLADAVSSAASHDSMVLKTFLTRHETGLYVLAAPESPAAADGITGADVERVLSMLAAEFAFVVVDTAPGLSEHTLAALDRTTDPVLLTSLDVPGLRGLRKEVDTLNELGMLTDARRLVVNFVDPRSGLGLADVEATIGARVDVALPRSRSVPSSVNVGVPLLQAGGSDKTTKQLRTLVKSLLAGSAVAKAAPQPRSWRSRRVAPAPRRAEQRWFAPARKAS